MEFFMFDRLFRSSKFNQYIRAYQLGQIPENHPCWNIIAFGSTRIVKTLDFVLFPEADGQNPVFEVQSFLSLTACIQNVLPVISGKVERLFSVYLHYRKFQAGNLYELFAQTVEEAIKTGKYVENKS